MVYSPWDQLFVVARNNEEAKREAKNGRKPLPEKICPSCRIRPCEIVKTTNIHAAYCSECRKTKNRRRSCDNKNSSGHTSG